jgi:hypothetical protein
MSARSLLSCAALVSTEQGTGALRGGESQADADVRGSAGAGGCQGRGRGPAFSWGQAHLVCAAPTLGMTASTQTHAETPVSWPILSLGPHPTPQASAALPLREHNPPPSWPRGTPPWPPFSPEPPAAAAPSPPGRARWRQAARPGPPRPAQRAAALTWRRSGPAGPVEGGKGEGCRAATNPYLSKQP